MTKQRTFHFLTLLSTLIGGSLLTGGSALGQTTGTSEVVTWSCTGSYCPWGPSTANPALPWPAAAQPLDTRFGYTVSKGIYLPAATANGAEIKITSGSAVLYVGFPDSAHYALTMVPAGGSYTVSGLVTGEVLSVQSETHFAYEITLPPPPEPEVPTGPAPGSTASEDVTWNCTGSPCPWGSSDAGKVLVWPASAHPVSSRLGYTTSKPAYLPADSANGAIIWINSGSATAYAGFPGAPSHYVVGTIASGQFLEISGLAQGEVLSVQSTADFSYQISLPEPPEEPENEDVEGTDSELVTWSCTGAPCPWGTTSTGHAVVWPEETEAATSRLGYTVSKGIYLPANIANGATIEITYGSANLYAGLPHGSSHYGIVSLMAGQSYEVAGLPPGEVLSVQSDFGFKYVITLPEPADPIDPADGDVIHSVEAFWRCNTPGCTSDDWVAAVIDWPSWAAYSTNNRSGDQSRTVYNSSNELLHPYMGSWADGCKVTAQSGTVLIIEWERGTDVWRQTWLSPGQTHVIDLVGSEDGAMIETYDYSPGFSVTLENCTPQPLP